LITFAVLAVIASRMDLDSIPPITGALGAVTIVITVLVHTHVINEFQLFYTPALVFRRFQFWRLLTSFFYFGPLGFDFFYHLCFLVRYSRMLEENSFGGRRGGRAGYVVLLLFAATLLLILSPVTAQPFLGSPLAFVLVYIWSRRNRHVRLSLFGVFVITAPYLPWSLVAFGWLLNGRIDAVIGDLTGILIGHLCEWLLSANARTCLTDLQGRLLAFRAVTIPSRLRLLLRRHLAART
jgi:Derlin-2/3